MPTSFAKFVLVQACGIAAFNASINALYTWYLWRSRSLLTLFAENAIAFDLSSTPGWIAFLSTLLGTASIRRKLREGHVATPDMAVPGAFGVLPETIPARAAVAGLLSAVVLGLPVQSMLQASGLDAVALHEAVLLKVAITVPMSLAIVPLVILAALADVRARLGPATA